MIVKPIKTKVITEGQNLFDILDRYMPAITDDQVVAITSKIVSICEGQIIDKIEIDKNQLIRSEADLVISGDKNKHRITIKNNILIPAAGIDESNADGKYILWPKNPYRTANRIRKYLLDKFGLKRLGVVITDSKTSPLRSGTTGVCLAFAGFEPVNSYIGTPDLFGRNLEVSKANIADGLAAASVVVMGEGSERTPLAIIGDCDFINFEIKGKLSRAKLLNINMDDDIYSPILKRVKWVKGRKY